MIARLLEAFFRHKLLILMPVIATPLLVLPAAFVLVKPFFEASAGVWVERPSYIPAAEDWNRYITPAQNQHGKLTEMLRTRAFIEDVARRTSLAPLLATSEGRDEVADYLQRSISAAASGNKLLNVRVRADSGEIAYEVIVATLNAFRDRSAADRATQTSMVIAFYEGQVKNAEEELSKARDALRRYLVANPRYSSIDPSARVVGASLGLPVAAIDPQLADLIRAQENAQKEQERLRGLLDQAQFDSQAALEGGDAAFQVVDQPVMPTTAQRERRRLIIFPTAALLVGLAVGGALLVILTVSDRSARWADDLDKVGKVIGVVPRMEVRVPRKALPRGATRKAIGFVAGTALPAPPKAQAS